MSTPSRKSIRQLADRIDNRQLSCFPSSPLPLFRVVTKMGNVELAFVAGDFARGLDTASIDLVFVGTEIDQEYLVRLVSKTEALIKRKIRYVIFGPEEFETYRKTVSNKDILLIWKREE